MKTLAEAKEEFQKRGQTVTNWALEHGFKAVNVRAVLRGRNKGRYGEGHKIAIALGIKQDGGDGSN